MYTSDVDHERSSPSAEPEAFGETNQANGLIADESVDFMQCEFATENVKKLDEVNEVSAVISDLSFQNLKKASDLTPTISSRGLNIFKM